MSGMYLARSTPRSLESAGEFFSGCLGPGRPTLHLHAEWQFAIPASGAGVSLGAFHRFPAEPHDLTVLPPYTAHAEVSAEGPEQRWHFLYVTRKALERLDWPRQGRRDGEAFSGPVIRTPRLAQAFRELVQTDLAEDYAGARFAARAREWLQQLLLEHRVVLRSLLGLQTPSTMVEPGVRGRIGSRAVPRTGLSGALTGRNRMDSEIFQ